MPVSESFVDSVAKLFRSLVGASSEHFGVFGSNTPCTWYVFYVFWRLWEAHLYVFYVSWRLWEAHLYVFYVSGRLRGGTDSDDL